MKRYTILLAILLSVAVVSAQNSEDLSARDVELARPRTIPFHNMTEAINGKTPQSRFVATVEELSRKDEGMISTFTTHFALPVSWLNRQVLLRVGSATSIYALFIVIVKTLFQVH